MCAISPYNHDQPDSAGWRGPDIAREKFMDEVMGRRERNNLERHARLLAVGRQLFDAQGVDATTVEQIAAAAQLSTRSVYNFFPTKVDLLAALLNQEILERIRSRQISGMPLLADPCDGVLALVRLELETLAAVSKSEQKLVAAHAILAGADSEAGRYTVETDLMLRTTIRDLLAHYVAHGALRQDFDPDLAAGLIFLMLNGLYLEWLQSDRALDAVMPVVAAYLRLILRA